VPPQSHFAPIDFYNIKILNAQGNYFEISFCDGTNSQVITKQTCSIPMLTLSQTSGLVTG